MRRSHRLAMVVLPALVLVAIAAILLAVGGRLPDPAAVHFGPGGRADGFAGTPSLVGVFLGFPVVMWALFAVVSRVAGQHAIGARALAALPLGIVTFFLGLTLATLLPQVDVADAAGITLPGWSIPVTVAAALVGGAIGAWAAGPSPTPPPATTGPRPDDPRTDLPGGVPVWRGVTPTGPTLRVVAALLPIVGIGTWWVAGYGPALVVFLATVVVVASSRYDVTIGPAGVVVRGALGWPRTTQKLSTLVRAEVADVRPFDYGGWGWRYAGGTTAVLTRRGPALVVERSDGARLAVSLEHPQEAAALLNGLLDRREEHRHATGSR